MLIMLILFINLVHPHHNLLQVKSIDMDVFQMKLDPIFLIMMIGLVL